MGGPKKVSSLSKAARDLQIFSLGVFFRFNSRLSSSFSSLIFFLLWMENSHNSTKHAKTPDNDKLELIFQIVQLDKDLLQ